MFMVLVGLIELNILSTRSPSFWWDFGRLASDLNIARTCMISTASHDLQSHYHNSKLTTSVCRRGAPPPSWQLLLPVGVFLMAGTFISVYWPEHVKPDGGRGMMKGAGKHAGARVLDTHACVSSFRL